MASTINRVMSVSDWMALIILGTVWGGSFFFVEVALKALSPLEIVFLRVLIAAAALWVFTLGVLGLKVPRNWQIWRALLIMALLNNVIPFSLIVWGQNSIASGEAAILNATTPIFTVIVAGLLLADEPLKPNTLLGAFIGFIGVFFLLYSSFDLTKGSAIWGRVAVLGAAVSYSFASVFGRRFKTMNVAPPLVAAGQVTASSLWLLPILIVSNPSGMAQATSTIWLAILGLALVSTAFAYLLFFRILARAGANNVALVTLLAPISAILLGVSFLGEQLLAAHLIGMAFIALGLSIVDGRLWRRVTNRVITKHR